MKFIWISLIIVIIINVTRAKNKLDIFLEHWNINRDLTKAWKHPSYIVTKRQSVGLFPSLPNSKNKFMVDLKPLKESYSQATEPEQYKKLFKREHSIKDLNNKNKDKIKAEVTTRKALKQKKKFTVRSLDVFQELVFEKYIWNSNRNVNKSKIPIKQTNFNKTIYDTIKNESKFLSFKNFYTSLNYKDYNISQKQNNKNVYVIPDSRKPDSRKPKITLLLPTGNNIKYFKENPEQSVSKQFHIHNFVFDSKVPFIVVSNNNKSEEKENIKVSPNASIIPDFKEEMDEVTEPENNFFDQDEFIPVSVNDILFLKPDIDDDEITTDSGMDDLVSRPKRSVNIIEEESVATTSGIRVSNQDHPTSQDLTFKNIHT